MVVPTSYFSLFSDSENNPYATHFTRDGFVKFYESYQAPLRCATSGDCVANSVVQISKHKPPIPLVQIIGHVPLVPAVQVSVQDHSRPVFQIIGEVCHIPVGRVIGQIHSIAVDHISDKTIH